MSYFILWVEQKTKEAGVNMSYLGNDEMKYDFVMKKSHLSLLSDLELYGLRTEKRKVSEEVIELVEID